MRRAILVTSLVLASSTARAETFDIVSFKAPAGFTKQDDGKRVSFTKTNAKGYCILGLYKSIAGTSDAARDLAEDWVALAATPFQISQEPTITAGPSVRGWTSYQATTSATIQGATAKVGVTTFSSPGLRVSALMLGTDGACPAVMSAWVKSFTMTARPVAAAPSETPTAHATTAVTANGWTSAARADWVEVTSSNATVLIHYPHAKADAYNSVLADGLRDAWNLLVAPHYKQVRNLQLRPIQSFESIGFAEAEATDHAGKSVYVVLFKKHASTGNGRYLEFITRDKRTFEQVFGAYRNDEFGWDALTTMAAYNRFPLTKEELAGTWISTDFASVAYYYVNTGNAAGASATLIADEFSFDASGTYRSDHAGASGEVGRAKFSRQTYRGKFTLAAGSLTLTNRFQGGSEAYAAHFEAVKGGKVLVLVDRLGTTKVLVRRR